MADIYGYMKPSEWIEIPTELFERLLAYAEAHGLTVRDVIEEAVTRESVSLIHQNN
jgi:NRPS condensation-like uncharacterized protein